MCECRAPTRDGRLVRRGGEGAGAWELKTCDVHAEGSYRNARGGIDRAEGRRERGLGRVLVTATLGPVLTREAHSPGRE